MRTCQTCGLVDPGPEHRAHEPMLCPETYTYTIEARGDAREVYYVEAADEDAARARFERGDVRDPVVSEVTSAEIVSVQAGRRS